MPKPSAKVDLPSTVAAVLGFAQAVAAADGVLAVWRTPSGLLDVPDAERLGVGILTTAVAVALAIGCARVLTGGSPRVLVAAAVVSLLISAYWILLRPPVDSFPDLAVSYAVLPVLSLGLIGFSALRTSRAQSRPAPEPVGEHEEVQEKPVPAPVDETPVPAWVVHDVEIHPDWSDSADDPHPDWSTAVDDSGRPWSPPGAEHEAGNPVRA